MWRVSVGGNSKHNLGILMYPKIMGLSLNLSNKNLWCTQLKAWEYNLGWWFDLVTRVWLRKICWLGQRLKTKVFWSRGGFGQVKEGVSSIEGVAPPFSKACSCMCLQSILTCTCLPKKDCWFSWSRLTCCLLDMDNFDPWISHWVVWPWCFLGCFFCCWDVLTKGPQEKHIFALSYKGREYKQMGPSFIKEGAQFIMVQWAHQSRPNMKYKNKV